MAAKKDTEKTAGQLRSEELIFKRKSVWENADKKTLKKIQDFSEGYPSAMMVINSPVGMLKKE